MQTQSRLKPISNNWNFYFLGRNIMLLAIALLLSIIPSACGYGLHSPIASPSTNTPTPTTEQTTTLDQTATPTRIAPLPSLYDLPDWMGNPLTDISVSQTTASESHGSSTSLLFLNATTGEKYEIKIPSEIGGYFWYDNMHFGLLSKDLKVMYLVDLKTGQVISSQVSQRSKRLLEIYGYLVPLQVREDPLSSDDVLFDYANRLGGAQISRETHYSAERNFSPREIIVTNLETREIVWRSNPSNAYIDISLAWSPANDSLLAIVEGKDSNDFFITDTLLIVLDVKTGTKIFSYKDDIGEIAWSPDGTKILFTSAISFSWNYGYGFKGAPCTVNIQTGAKNCLWNIPNHQIPNGYSLATSTGYQYSPDGKSLYFVYEYDSQSGMKGDLCMYSFTDGKITCPTTNIEKLPEWDTNWQGSADGSNGWSINPYSYSFSPSGKYIQFYYSSNSLLSDNQGGPGKNALIDRDGTKVITWSGSETAALWRPLP